MSYIIGRRAVLTGLFVAPAIVAATNIMPIKAIEKFTLSDFNPNNEKWVLAKSRIGKQSMWIRNSQFDIYAGRENYDIVKTQFLEPVINHKNQWAEDITRLNKVYQTHVVTTPLPSNMISFSDQVTGFELPSFVKQKFY